MSADEVRLGHALAALAKEMDLPRRSILAVERHIGAALRAGPAGRDLLRDLQNLDLAVQVLADLRSCLEALSRSVSVDFRVDAAPALQSLRLERVATSLRTELGIPSAPLPPARDLELF